MTETTKMIDDSLNLSLCRNHLLLKETLILSKTVR